MGPYPGGRHPPHGGEGASRAKLGQPAPVLGVNRGFRTPAPVIRRPYSTQTFTLAGITRDNAGNPLGFCDVRLFEVRSDRYVAMTVSDAGGNYSFQVGSNMQFYIVPYLAGTPDVTGASLRSLVGV